MTSRTRCLHETCIVGRLATVTEVLDAFNRKGPPRLLAAFQSIPGMVSANRYLPSSIVGIGDNVDSLYVQLDNGMRLVACRWPYSRIKS